MGCRELDTTEQVTLSGTCTSGGAGRGNICQRFRVHLLKSALPETAAARLVLRRWSQVDQLFADLGWVFITSSRSIYIALYFLCVFQIVLVFSRVYYF